MKSTKDTFTYWVAEREEIRYRKEHGLRKPWSTDPIFQNTYFCNVRREDDKVTKWIRAWLSPLKGELIVPYLVLARMLNFPESLEELDVNSRVWNTAKNLRKMKKRRDRGEQVFNGAYLITTCGVRMDKLDYVFNVASDVAHMYLGAQDTCYEQWWELQKTNGIGSFLAAQVVADLKNTPWHRLSKAEDWWYFCASGPGSIKGLNYFFNRPVNQGLSRNQFLEEIEIVRKHLPPEDKGICNQDLQNCLCEYGKYMRVQAGGRSKRNYPGE